MMKTPPQTNRSLCIIILFLMYKWSLIVSLALFLFIYNHYRSLINNFPSPTWNDSIIDKNLPCIWHCLFLHGLFIIMTLVLNIPSKCPTQVIGALGGVGWGLLAQSAACRAPTRILVDEVR